MQQLGLIFSVVLNNLVSILFMLGAVAKGPLPIDRFSGGAVGGRGVEHTHKNILNPPLQKVFPPHHALWMTVICD
jgi:hypothetical protein